MKTLYLLRHAKSSWKDPALADFDRPLNERGRRAAPFMGRLAKERGLTIDVIRSSPAKRARDTAELFCSSLGFDVEILHDEQIYEATPGTLLHVVSETDDRVEYLLLVGHNPGMEALIRLLTHRIEPMPTAALAVIEIPIGHWAELAPGTGTLTAVLRPREEMADDRSS